MGKMLISADSIWERILVASASSSFSARGALSRIGACRWIYEYVFIFFFVSLFFSFHSSVSHTEVWQETVMHRQEGFAAGR